MRGANCENSSKKADIHSVAHIQYFSALEKYDREGKKAKKMAVERLYKVNFIKRCVYID